MHMQPTLDNTYEGHVAIDETTTLNVTSATIINAKEGRVFDYVLSRIQALGLTNTTLTFHTSELLDELGLTNRTENRNTILHSLNNLVNVEVSLLFDDEAIIIYLLESVQEVDGNHEMCVTLSQSFIDAMHEDVAKTRYVNIARTMKAKSTYTIELAKLLQMDGRGVVKGSGIPQPVHHLAHTRVCDYLGLNPSSATSRTTLRKAFRELQTLRYPSYAFNGRMQEWQIRN